MSQVIDPRNGQSVPQTFTEMQIKEFERAKRHGFTDDELKQPIKTVRPGKRRAMPKPDTVVRGGPKIGRNEPCPCNSGRKYKRCHMPGAV